MEEKIIPANPGFYVANMKHGQCQPRQVIGISWEPVVAWQVIPFHSERIGPTGYGIPIANAPLSDGPFIIRDPDGRIHAWGHKDPLANDVAVIEYLQAYEERKAAAKVKCEVCGRFMKSSLLAGHMLQHAPDEAEA